MTNPILDFIHDFILPPAETEKHLQGKHNQAMHGRRGGAGGGESSSAPAKGAAKPAAAKPGKTAAQAMEEYIGSQPQRQWMRQAQGAAGSSKPKAGSDDAKHTALIKTVGESLYNPQMNMTDATRRRTIDNLKKSNLSPENKKLLQHVEDFHSGKTTLRQFATAMGTNKKAGVPPSQKPAKASTLTDDQRKSVETIKLGKPSRGLGGNWQNGRMADGTRISARIYNVPSKYGIKVGNKGGRTSKLWIKKADGKIINYDRGWDKGTTANDKEYAAAVAAKLESLYKGG